MHLRIRQYGVKTEGRALCLPLFYGKGVENDADNGKREAD